MIEYPIYISITVLYILVQTDPLSAQQYIITGHKLYFTISICCNERALDTYCTSVCESYGTASQYCCGYLGDFNTLFMSVCNSVVTMVSHCV